MYLKEVNKTQLIECAEIYDVKFVFMQNSLLIKLNA